MTSSTPPPTPFSRKRCAKIYLQPTYTATDVHEKKGSKHQFKRATPPPSFPLQAADRWLAVRLESVGNAVVCLATLLSVRAAFGSVLPPGILPAIASPAIFSATVPSSLVPPAQRAVAAATAATLGAVPPAAATAASRAVSRVRAHVMGRAAAAATAASAAAAAAARRLPAKVSWPPSAAGAAGRRTAAAAAGGGSAGGAARRLRTAGLAGLAVSNAMTVTSFLQWVVRVGFHEPCC